MNRGAYPTKGPGDVWPTGDSTPTYCPDDAHADIATQLHDADEVAELVGDVVRARAALDWIALHVDVPRKHRTALDLLASQSRQLAKREDEYGRLFCGGRKAA